MNYAWLAQRPWLMVLGLMVAIAIGLYFAPIMGKTVFASPDSLSPTAIRAGLNQLAQTEGTMPLWQPGRFSGMPTLHAFSNISALYLPDKIMAILRSLGMTGISDFIIHLIFGAMGTWILLRHLGASAGAAALGATGFMMMPYTQAMIIHGHGGQMMTLMYMPWVVWSLIRLQETPGYKEAALLALFTGLHLQRGHAQISYYILLMSGLIYLALAIRMWREEHSSASDLVRFSALSVGGLTAGLALAASLFLPVINYAPYSVRGASETGGAGFDYATQWSFSIGETSTWIIPSYYGFGGSTYWGNMPFTDFPNYMGIVLLALAVWAVWRCRKWWSYALSAAALLAYLLSLGDNFFLYRVFYDVMPYFSKFRVPAMLLVITQFSVVVLAGMGLDDLLKTLSASKEPAVRKGLLYAGAGIAGVGLVLWSISRSLIPSLPAGRGIPAQFLPQINAVRLAMINVDTAWLLVISVLALALLWRWRTQRLSTRFLMLGLIALTIVDLGRVDQEMIMPKAGSFRATVQQPARVFARNLQPDPVIRFLQAEPGPFRIYPLGGLQADSRWAAFGLSSIGGYHPAKLANYERFMRSTGFRGAGLLQMLNVRYLISLERFSDARFEEVFVGNLFHGGRYVPAAVYRFGKSMSRAWFPGQLQVAVHADSILARLKATDYDPQAVVYTLDGRPGAVTPGGQGVIASQSWSPSHIALTLEVQREGLLVLSEIYYPGGWVARLGGDRLPIIEVNTILRGVVVPRGSHQLTLDFEPQDVRVGMMISRVALLLILSAFAPALYARARKKW